MSILKLLPFAFFFLLLQSACKPKADTFDASGSFEAEPTLISSEMAGIMKQFRVEEGQQLKAGDTIGYIDTIQLHLRKKQLQAQIQAVLGKRPDVPVQLASLKEQLKTAEKEKMRFTNLVKGDAATQKQLDDIVSQIDVITKQIEAERSRLEITSSGFTKEATPYMLQIEQLDDQIKKSIIINPVPGTVLNKYAMESEMAAPGKPLYKIADLSTIILRAFISANQLPEIKIGQEVTVLTDDGSGGMHEAKGTITWISDVAEFTPKTVQTKDERANMVYAIKVRLPNDGTYKIGMYGEIKF